MTADELFLAAVEKANPDERAAFLESACQGNVGLRAQVEGLLKSYDAAASFLEQPLFKPATIEACPSGERPGASIGPYKLLQQIGEGGMGVVWMAEQTQPVQRKVALKVIKQGMDTGQVIARFEAERQALAMMDHVNIARVIDGGATENGRPYFVMELVHGVPITKFCDDNHLTPRERLELFVPVCQAIQHAHQKGIIHRDIKPSNVMVTLYDGKPVPKVIDFGVAKATEQRLTERTLFTQYGTMVGTLEYMSPEQAEFSALGVDTRSDIYSLGVLLYELLTGNTPLTHKRMKEAAYAEILRMIKEEEPPKPSTRLSDSGEALASISANRHMEPAKLTKLVKGELDWIVMKTLEKDRNRRYETASGLAMDVQRYLADEAVLACPPSAGYRFRKFARRNRAALMMASVVGLALLLGVGSFGWVVRDREARRARATIEVNQFLQRADSLYAENKLTEVAVEVEKARGVLEASGGEEELGRRVQQWLTDLDTVEKCEEMRRKHSDVVDWDSEYAKHAQIMREYGIDVEVLSAEEAATRIAGSRIRFELTVSLDTWAYRLRFDPRSLEPARWERLFAITAAADPDPLRLHLKRAVNTKDVKALRAIAEGSDVGRLNPRTLEYLAGSLSHSGDPDAAVAMLRQAQRQRPGDFLINQALADCLTRLKPPPWCEVIAFRRVALALRPKSAAAHTALGYALQQTGRTGEAIEAHREAGRLGPSNPDLIKTIGWSLQSQKKFPEMEAAFREVVRLKPDDPAGHHGLGRALLGQKKVSEGVESLRDAIRLGSTDHWAYDALGWALLEQERPAEAEAAFRQVVRLKPKLDHGYFALARAMFDQKKFADAETAAREALCLNPTHPWAGGLLRQALVGQGKSAEAEELGKKSGQKAAESEKKEKSD